MEEIKQKFVEAWLPQRPKTSYKGNYGHVLVIGGQWSMAGAGLLAASAAVYSGAGLVTLATDAQNFPAVHSRLPELMCCDFTDQTALESAIERASLVLIGPGLGRDRVGQAILRQTLNQVKSQQQLVMDADALTLYSQGGYPESAAPVTITPHLGEWERLSGMKPTDLSADRVQAYQQQLGMTLVLKGAPTTVYQGGQVWVNTVGGPSMATGGMGDCLAGMIAGFVAQTPDQPLAACLSAVYLHSWIADQLARDQYVTLPHQLIEQIPWAMKFMRQDHS